VQSIFLALALSLLLPNLAAADTFDDAPETDAFGDGLSAETIYARVLDNRFESSVQELALVSADRAGRELLIRLQMLWRRYGEETDEAASGVVSRTVIRYLDPPAMRRTGYLVVNRRDAPNDQFIYLESMRRIRRVNLRSETLAGTDLNVEDVVPRELDDATYRRVPDEMVGDTPCFVVEATPKPETDSKYSRLLLYVEKEHYVPLRVRYWDDASVEIKELRSPAAAIYQVDGIYFPTIAKMRNLLMETSTEARVVTLAPNPDLPSRYFSQRQLESKKLKIPKKLLVGIRSFGQR